MGARNTLLVYGIESATAPKGVGRIRPAGEVALHRRSLPPDQHSRITMELDGIVRAPDFPTSLDWLHTGGRRLTLADFRGKLLLLDFWTYG